MGDYRRRLFMEARFPRLAVLLATAVLYLSAASPWFVLQGLPLQATHAVEHAVGVTEGYIAADAALAEAEAARVLAAPVEGLPAPSLRFLAQGQADATLVGSSLTNALIAISFIDEYVIEPGTVFSFDDVARTWDFREDPAYLWSLGTSRYGFIDMRGGGVCWVSTALWRAALYAGLPTEFRQNHLGMVPNLGIGTDATNTLAIRNDSKVPITVRAWMDDEAINVALLAPEALDRKGSVRGPERSGPGTYVLYQDVTWADGRKHTMPFYSGYYW